MEVKEAVKKKGRIKSHKRYQGVKVLDGIAPKIVIEHCEALGIEPKMLSSCLAVNPKTIQRWKDGIAEPNESAQRSLDKLEAIYQLTARLLKKDDWRSWFYSPNHTLGGESPVDLLSRGEFDQVKNVLGMLEWGIYS